MKRYPYYKLALCCCVAIALAHQAQAVAQVTEACHDTPLIAQAVTQKTRADILKEAKEVTTQINELTRRLDEDNTSGGEASRSSYVKQAVHLKEQAAKLISAVLQCFRQEATGRTFQLYAPLYKEIISSFHTKTGLERQKVVDKLVEVGKRVPVDTDYILQKHKWDKDIKYTFLQRKKQLRLEDTFYSYGQLLWLLLSEANYTWETPRQAVKRRQAVKKVLDTQRAYHRALNAHEFGSVVDSRKMLFLLHDFKTFHQSYGNKMLQAISYNAEDMAQLVALQQAYQKLQDKTSDA